MSSGEHELGWLQRAAIGWASLFDSAPESEAPDTVRDMTDTEPSPCRSTLPACAASVAPAAVMHPVYARLLAWQDARSGGVREFQISRTSGFFVVYLQDDYLLHVSDLHHSREAAISQALILARWDEVE